MDLSSKYDGIFLSAKAFSKFTLSANPGEKHASIPFKSSGTR